MMRAENQNPAERLAAIVAAGVSAYEATLPAHAQRSGVETDAPETCTGLAVTEARQIELCLNCPLADCASVQSALCPIRQESRREWKRRCQSQRRVSQ